MQPPTTLYSAPDIARETSHSISGIYAAIERLGMVAAFQTKAGLKFYSPEQVTSLRANMGDPRPFDPARKALEQKLN